MTAVIVRTTKPKKILALPDIHFPHHDPAVLACVLAIVRAEDPDEIVDMGDLLDGAAFSSHPARNFADRAPSYLGTEVGPANDFLDKLQGRKKRKLVMCEGNHELRCESRALNMGPAGSDIHRLVSPRTLIENRVNAQGQPRGKRENFTWIPYLGKGVHSRYLIAPESKYSSALITVHGWSTAKSAARVHLDLARDVSVIHGHTHREQTALSRHRLTGRRIKAWSPGCLCKLIPTYCATSPNDWTQGVSLIYVYDDRWIDFMIPIFSDGSCTLPSGRRVIG